jgi:hypothetical protein
MYTISNIQQTKKIRTVALNLDQYQAIDFVVKTISSVVSDSVPKQADDAGHQANCLLHFDMIEGTPANTGPAMSHFEPKPDEAILRMGLRTVVVVALLSS